jgi:hypothetical protein
MHRVQATTLRTSPLTTARTDCKFGRCHFRVLMLEWLTLWALWRPLPQYSHVLAMAASPVDGSRDVAPLRQRRNNAPSRADENDDKT